MLQNNSLRQQQQLSPPIHEPTIGCRNTARAAQIFASLHTHWWRAGRLEKAVTALELGRTRELGLLTLAESIDLEALSHLDPGLRVELENAITSFRADILGLEDRSASDRSEQFARIRSALRQIPTFEKALDPPTLDEIGKVAQPQRPLVYLGSAPRGSFAIIVDRSEDAGVRVEAIHAPDCDSQAIVHLAMFGLDADGTQVASAAYLAAQAHAPERLDTAIVALSPLIGEKLLRPLADSLAGRGASGVTLVPAGLLGLMPLHAIAWSDAAGNRRSLIDDYDVTFAPSARLQLACMQRASRRVGDPIRLSGSLTPSRTQTRWRELNSRSGSSKDSCRRARVWY